MEDKIIVGSEEWCSLPDLSLPLVKARIDSGAKTSSLHAFNIHIFEDKGESIVEFDVHPIQHNRKIVVHCKAKLIDHRLVRSSSGENERRYVIQTTVNIGGSTWPIELNLSNRDSMGYRMLLGREAMSGKILVDPSANYSMGDYSAEQVAKKYKVSSRAKNKLRIVILSSDPLLYSNKRLIEAGESSGHEMIFINVKKACMNISAGLPEIFYDDDKPIGHVDAVIPRLKHSMTYYGCTVARQFQSAGAFCLNDAASIKRTRDKLLCLQMLAEKAIDMPVTSFADSPDKPSSLIKQVGGAPVIIKLLESGQSGKKVILAETAKAAESVINAFRSLKANILVQEYIKDASGREIRCFVIDGRVIASMQRKTDEADLKSASLSNGKVATIKLKKSEKKMAAQAAKIMGLKVAGVDILRSVDGPKILDIHSMPSLENIESVTGLDIASMMIKSIEHHILGTNS